MDLLETDASPDHAMQCIKWCIENSEPEALDGHLKLHASKLSTYTAEYVHLLLDSGPKQLSSTLLLTFLPYVDDAILHQELFKGGKTVINKMTCQSVVNRDIDIVNNLLQRGADSNAHFHGKPLLQLAACCGDVKLVDCLVKHGADVNAVDKRGDNVLYAVMTSQLDTKASMATHLIKLGVNIHQTSASGKYPLHIAAAHSGDIIETLIAEGQHVDVIDDVNKDTPLHIACGLCCQDTIVRLIQHGAKFNLVNGHGETPLTKLLKFTTDFHDFHSRTRINVARKLLAIGFRMQVQTGTEIKQPKGRNKTLDKYLTLIQSAKEVPSLQSISRVNILTCFRPNCSPVNLIRSINIPQHLKNYLLFRDNTFSL